MKNNKIFNSLVMTAAAHRKQPLQRCWLELGGTAEVACSTDSIGDKNRQEPHPFLS